MIKKAVQIGNPIVRTNSTDVPFEDIPKKSTQNLIRDLIDSMHSLGLIGMAAPQIGVNLNVFVIQLRKTETRKKVSKRQELYIFINPKLSNFSKEQTILMEGCGSLDFANLFGPVKRPKKVTVTALNEKGEEFTMKADGLMAKCLQHEFDHLRGIICIDKFTDTRKVSHREEYKKKK